MSFSLFHLIQHITCTATTTTTAEEKEMFCLNQNNSNKMKDCQENVHVFVIHT